MRAQQPFFSPMRLRITLQKEAPIISSIRMPHATMIRKAKYSGATLGMESLVALAICSSVASATFGV